MWPSQNDLDQQKALEAQLKQAAEQRKAREIEIWNRGFTLRQTLDQRWNQILDELERGLLSKEAFEGYRLGLKRLCLNNNFRILDSRLL